MRGHKKGYYLIALGLLAGASALPAIAREKVDLILHHGKILTVDRTFSIKSVVVVKGDKIVAVGGEELRGRYEAGEEIDLAGRTLLPGFTDTHLHPQPVAPMIPARPVQLPRFRLC